MAIITCASMVGVVRPAQEGGGVRVDEELVVVAGGTGVVGSAVVRRLVGSGRRVALLYHRNADAVAGLRAELDVSSERLVAVAADLSRAEEVDRVADAITDITADVASFVHAAADVDQTSLADMTAVKFTEVLATNVTSAFLLTRALAERTSLSSVVLVSSIGADFTGTGSVAYESSRGAVNSLIRALAAELAPRVRVNGVAPGVVRSHRTERDPTMSNPALINRIPGRGLVDADQLAQTIEFLVGLESQAITGQVLRVDDGMSLRLF